MVRVAPFAVVLALAAVSAAALAQSPPAAPPQTAPAARPAAAPPPAQAPGSQLPSSITVELKGQQSSSPTVAPWIVAVIGSLGGLLAAIGGVVVAVYQANRANELQTKLEGMRSSSAAGLQDTKLGYDRERDETDRAVKSSEHKDRITLQMRELQQKMDLSDYEAFMAAKRLIHDRDLAQANLVHTFFDKLLSESQSERNLALFAISAFVEPEKIARLAAGGDAVVSRESLSRLAARGEEEMAAVAQKLLNAELETVKSSVVLVSLENSTVMAANAFICGENLIVTYPVVEQGRTFAVSQEPSGTKAVATCLAIDRENFLAIARVSAPLAGKPLPLREQPVRTGLSVRMAQWSGDRFVVRAGAVTATGDVDSVYAGPGQPRKLTNAITLRVLSEPGSAGAPVLDEEGRVIGVIVAGLPGQESSSAVPVSAVTKLLLAARTSGADGRTAAAAQPAGIPLG